MLRLSLSELYSCVCMTPQFPPTHTDPWFFKAFVAVLGIIWMHLRTVVYVSSTIGQPKR